jgi:hypothetical protein
VTTTTTGPLGTTGHSGLARVRFYPRQLLEADDLRSEQAYHRERSRRHNRFVHGWGVVSGCQVQAIPTSERPWQVRVCPGYLLTPDGDEVFIPSAAMFDIADCTLSSGDPCAFARPCPPISRLALVARRLYLAVRYVECEGRPMRLPGDNCSCGCRDTGAATGGVRCEYSRIQDGYELCCLSAVPPTHEAKDPACPDLCGGTIIPFPSPTVVDPWVILATLTLPDAGVPLSTTEIDELTHRRLLYPASAVQSLARCTCSGGGDVFPTPTPPPF